jgi:uncharacterized protein with HEPN domain
VRLAAEAAVTRIGEAARHLPEEITALAPDVPWAQIRGMRNVMTHAYFDIETDVLWTTIARDIPALADHVRALLEKLPD